MRVGGTGNGVEGACGADVVPVARPYEHLDVRKVAPDPSHKSQQLEMADSSGESKRRHYIITVPVFNGVITNSHSGC